MSAEREYVFRPRLIFWELTTGCNLRCIHCRASATDFMSPDDLSYREACEVIDQVADYAPFILVLSGGEPLWRKDVFELVERARRRNILVALATNGTLVDAQTADRIVASGVRRVAISLDGAESQTHDRFRGQPGALDAALTGFRNLRSRSMSMQINTTVSRLNFRQLPQLYQLALDIGADAFHIFLLIPVGCGLTIQDEQTVSPLEYEQVLNWLYDRSLESRIELKATCAPHYFRIVRQRRAEDRRAGRPVPPLPSSRSAGHPHQMNAVTRGCLAGSGVCFISHRGEVYPCGYLPISAGNLLQQRFRDVWEQGEVFQRLRDLDNLEGKCGYCEFRQICLGCRARAYGVTGNYLAEEPFCIYQPSAERASLRRVPSSGAGNPTHPQPLVKLSPAKQ